MFFPQFFKPLFSPPSSSGLSFPSLKSVSVPLAAALLALLLTAPGLAAGPDAPALNTPLRNPEPGQPAPASAKLREKTPTRPGHPFTIQNRKENYRSSLSAKTTAELDAALAGLIGGTGEKAPGLAVIVFKNGEEVYRNMLGNRFLSPRNANWNLPVTADSRFRVASLSKMFTGAAIMQLAEQGKIDLDGDSSRYLGFTLRNPRYPRTVITPRMLLSHTSSVRDYPTAYIPYATSAKAHFSTPKSWAKTGQAPGDYFSYSNLNYILLGTMIEKISGQRFDAYMTQNLLRPLEIYGSFNPKDFNETELRKLGTIYRKPQGEKGRYYAQIDDRPFSFSTPSSRSAYRPGTNAGVFSPQGGLRISPEELSHLLQMFMNNGTYKGKKILRPSSVALMTKPAWNYMPSHPNGDIEADAIESYGLATQYFSGRGSTKPAPGRPDFNLVGHVGEAYGFIGGVMWQPGTKNGFLFLQNGQATPESRNKGRYSRNLRWEENIMSAVIRHVFPR